MDDDPESELLRQFHELAGAAPGTTEFYFDIRGCHIRVHYGGGSVSHFALSAPYPSAGAAPQAPMGGAQTAYRHPAGAFVAIRPMKIKLRRQTDEDRAAKARGSVRATQTGDPSFDHEVYIDSPSDALTTQRVLASRDLREGVRALLAQGFEHVIVDDKKGEIQALLLQFTRVPSAPDRAQRTLDAFAALACNTPSVLTSSEQRPADTERALLIIGGALCVVCLVAGIPGYFLAAGTRCDDNAAASLLSSSDGCLTPVAMGLLPGFFAGLVLGTLVARRFRGRSDSHQRATSAAAIVLVLSIEVAIALSALLLWAR